MTNEPTMQEEFARAKATVAAEIASKGNAKPYRAPWWRFTPPIPHPLVTIDGRVVKLRLSWRRLDTIGHNGVRELFSAAASGEAGAMQATAELLDLFSAGEITVAEAMERPIRYQIAVAKLYEEWLICQYGPPKGRLRQWWAHLTNRPVALSIS